MTTIQPGILDMIETGDLVIYRDAAGKSYTIRDVIEAKRTGAYQRLRPQLTQAYVALPDIPESLTLPNLVPRATTNADLANGMRQAGLKYTTNDSAPKMQPLMAPDDGEKLLLNYPSIVRTDTFLNTLLGGVEPEQAGETLVRLISTGLLEVMAEPNRLLSYTQNARNVGASKQIYASVRNIMQVLLAEDVDNPIAERLTHLLREIVDIAKTHFYGTGSALGQLGRLAKGFEIANSAKAMRDKDGMWEAIMDRDTFFAIMDRARPISAIPTNDELNVDPLALIDGASAQVTDLINGNTIDISLVHITKTADAGFPWENNATKENSIIADVFLLKAMHDLLSSTTPGVDPATAFAAKFAWTRFHKIKAKAEIYEYTKMHTKIRNISVPANVIMILPQMVIKLVKWATSTLQRPINPKATNASLMGYAPFRGGHEKLMDKITSTPRSILHYADNLFVYEDGRYASMDASSMEAVHTPRSIQLCLEYILARGFGCMFVNGEIKSGGTLGNINAWLVHAWFGSIVAASPGVLRSFIIDVPGLASGMPGTFEFNDMLMAVAADIISRTSLSQPLLRVTGQPTKTVTDICQSIGLTMKTETCFPGLTPNSNPTLVTAAGEPWTPVTEDGTICETDMLGFDTLYVSIGNKPQACVAVLSRSRLLKALTFNKSDLRNIPLGPTTHAVIQLATLNILYLSGAWAHLDLAIAIEVTTKSIMSEINLGATVSAVNDAAGAAEITSAALARAAQTVAGEELLDESMARGILRSMLATGLIPLTEVFRIIHSERLSSDLLNFALTHPNLTGPKLMRLIGPINIAENIDRIRPNPGSWVQPLLSSALRALEHLQPLIDDPKPGTSTAQLPKDTSTAPPGKLPPTTPVPTRSMKRRQPDMDAWNRIIRLAQIEAGPDGTLNELLLAVVTHIGIDFELFGASIPVIADPTDQDTVRSVAMGLVTRIGADPRMVDQIIDSIGRLIAVGAIAVLEPPAKRQRRM